MAKKEPKIENTRPSEELNVTLEKKMGRPKLKESRAPFTTSLTAKNKGKLEMLSSLRGKRKADILNEIMAYYFEHGTSEIEQGVLKAFDKKEL